MDSIMRQSTIESCVRMLEDYQRTRKYFSSHMAKYFEAREAASRYFEKIVPEMIESQERINKIFVEQLPALNKAIERLAQFHTTPEYRKSPGSVSQRYKQQTVESPRVSMGVYTKTINVAATEVQLDTPSALCLPPHADQLNDHIALCDKHGNYLYFWKENQWIEERIEPMEMRIIQYLRGQELRPNYFGSRAVDLGKKLSKATTTKSQQVSINNRINRIETLCEHYKAVPLVINTGLKWRFNPALVK